MKLIINVVIEDKIVDDGEYEEQVLVQSVYTVAVESTLMNNKPSLKYIFVKKFNQVYTLETFLHLISWKLFV